MNIKSIRLSAYLLLLLAADASASLDRPYTLRTQEPHALERQREFLLLEDSLGLGFASPIIDRSVLPPRPPRLSYSNEAKGESLGLNLVAGEEFRYADEGAWATEAGGILSGSKGFATFNVDARLFSETSRAAGALPYDREEVDSQDEAATGSLSYASYSRYRGDFTLDTQLGKLSVARDAAHWGPGIFNNLAFNQDAVPFDQIIYHASIGPVKVTSLYGDLIAGPSQAFSVENLKGRNLYAHRYELSLGKDWLIGVGEQLILYGQNKPYLFAPVFPLFMAKGFMYEEANNGNLSVDLAYRLPGRGMLYTEFLLDDLESPSSLILKRYSQNKWGWLAGAHVVAVVPMGTLGVIAEYARVEPWTYAHFSPNTAQAANADYPLGNPNGPNSMNGTLKAYLRATGGFYLGLTQSLTWKGADPGSALNDPAPRNATTPKTFLGGAGDPDYSVRPEIHWNGKGFSLGFNGEFGARTSFWTGIRYFY